MDVFRYKFHLEQMPVSTELRCHRPSYSDLRHFLQANKYHLIAKKNNDTPSHPHGNRMTTFDSSCLSKRE